MKTKLQTWLATALMLSASAAFASDRYPREVVYPPPQPAYSGYAGPSGHCGGCGQSRCCCHGPVLGILKAAGHGFANVCDVLFHYDPSCARHCSTPACAAPACAAPVCAAPVCAAPVCAAPVCAAPVCAAPRCAAPVCSAPVCSAPKCCAPVYCPPKCCAPVAPKCCAPTCHAPKCSAPTCCAPTGCYGGGGAAFYGARNSDIAPMPPPARRATKESETKTRGASAQAGPSGRDVVTASYEADFGPQEGLRPVTRASKNPLRR